jgi:hypothetical protein
VGPCAGGSCVPHQIHQACRGEQRLIAAEGSWAFLRLAPGSLICTRHGKLYCSRYKRPDGHACWQVPSLGSGDALLDDDICAALLSTELPDNFDFELL